MVKIGNGGDNNINKIYTNKTENAGKTTNANNVQSSELDNIWNNQLRTTNENSQMHVQVQSDPYITENISILSDKFSGISEKAQYNGGKTNLNPDDIDLNEALAYEQRQNYDLEFAEQ